MTESFSDDETTLLNRYAEPHAFADLLGRWQRVTESLEGYDFTIYDYDDDVDSRVLLQDALDRAPVDLQVKGWAVLRPFDEAFLIGTVWVSRSRYPQGGWHARLPIKPGVTMQADIEDENL